VSNPGLDRLLDASRRRFEAYCRERSIRLRENTFVLEAQSDIPFKVGLAGSSAIVTAAVRAQMDYHEVAIPQHELPGLILSVETEELGMPGGLMDRVAQVYGGLTYMNLSAERLEAYGYSDVRPLPPANLPPLFVAFRSDLAEGSEVVHGDLRRRFDAREALVLDTMAELAALADRARDLIEADRGHEIVPLMDRNLELRDRVAPISEGNRELVRCGRQLGAGVKFAGSGGAVVGAYDGDPGRLAALLAAYTAIGAGFLVPEIA
jgi:glucuronokinase